MATVNNIHAHSWKQTKSPMMISDGGGGGGFFLCCPHVLPLTGVRFLEPSTAFLFSFLTTMIFLFMYRFHCWFSNILSSPTTTATPSSSYSFDLFFFYLLRFGFRYFSFYSFSYRWKPNCHSKIFGRFTLIETIPIRPIPFRILHFW